MPYSFGRTDDSGFPESMRMCVCACVRTCVCVWITHNVHYSCEEELIFYLTLQILLFVCVTPTLGGIDLCLRHFLP